MAQVSAWGWSQISQADQGAAAQMWCRQTGQHSHVLLLALRAWLGDELLLPICISVHW